MCVLVYKKDPTDFEIVILTWLNTSVTFSSRRLSVTYEHPESCTVSPGILL